VRTSILLLLLLTACEPVLATVTSLEPQIPDGPPADVDLRVALVIDGEARAYDIDLDGELTLVASQPVVAPKSHVAISPDGTRWAFCDRPRPFGDAVLWAGPIGEAEDLALPSDCHHPTLDVDGEIAWAQFGDGSSLRLHSARGLPLDFDGLRQPRSTLWHPRIDPSGSWVTMVASTSSDIGPVTVLDRNSGEVWQTVRESRGGWRDVNDGTLAAATSDGILMVGLNRRVDEHWSVFHHFGDACDALADDWPCDLTPREVGLSAAGRVAVATAPARGSDRWDGWPLVLVDGPVAARVLAADGSRYGWPLWGQSERYVYALRDGHEVVRVPVAGGEPEVLLEGDLTGWGGWSATR